jgi:hypothetical protein
MPQPGPLTRYLGARPFEVVDGQAFITDPIVSEAVYAAVSDQEVANRVLSGGLASPINRVAHHLRAAGCEPHNCAYRHWAVYLDDRGYGAAVCFYDEDFAPHPRWYGDDETKLAIMTSPSEPSDRRCP